MALIWHFCRRRERRRLRRTFSATSAATISVWMKIRNSRAPDRNRATLRHWNAIASRSISALIIANVTRLAPMNQQLPKSCDINRLNISLLMRLLTFLLQLLKWQQRLINSVNTNHACRLPVELRRWRRLVAYQWDVRAHNDTLTANLFCTGYY